jgi:hypothetical protein
MALATRASEARSSEVRARAEANFKKEERAKEGAKAMTEYQTNGRVVREQMARLRELRLAKEAAEKVAGVAAKPASKPAKKATGAAAKSTAKSASRKA